MDLSEFNKIMSDLGYRNQDCKKLLNLNDVNNDGVLSFSEFVETMIALEGPNDPELPDGSFYDKNQVVTFTKLINSLLKDDKDLKGIVPIAASGP